MSDENCVVCGKHVPLMYKAYIPDVVCHVACQGDYEEMIGQQKEHSTNVILTTSMFVANREIDHEVDIVVEECAFGMNVFRDFFAGVRDIVGGRSKASEKVLRDAKDQALSGIRRQAAELGADAVIAVDLDYSELSGGGKSGILLAIASGTAVKLKPKSEPDPVSDE